MGLDSYARNNNGSELTEEQEKLFDGIELCGGMFSGNGCGGSFRGKVYNNFIQDISGVSLYTEELEVCEVTRIVEALEHYKDDVLSEDCAPDLYKFFKVCDENDLTVCGWW